MNTIRYGLQEATKTSQITVYDNFASWWWSKTLSKKEQTEFIHSSNRTFFADDMLSQGYTDEKLDALWARYQLEGDKYK